ncbi:Ribonuclease CAF1 [Artemisia annua]|uniref:Ribonuclease CAF1 n=1 Tax=Artemisia annua TaxID=35608 RepID=A0A2U1MNE9_ARTAN|nr:Ribonuclease CAF1 [Artemisia annua]
MSGIHGGISYLSRAHEDEARLQLHSTHEDALTELQCAAKEINDVPLVRMAGILFVERMRNKMTTWHDDLSVSDHIL